MKTFGDLKVGDIVFSKVDIEKIIREDQIEEISFIDDRAIITFVNQVVVNLDRNAIAYIKPHIAYFADKKAIASGLTTMIKDLKHELQTCEQLLREYESESIK